MPKYYSKECHVQGFNISNQKRNSMKINDDIVTLGVTV